MAHDQLPDCTSLSEASKMLKVHPNTLLNWDKSGTLKPIRVGERKIRRYKKEDVLRFLEQND